MVEWKQVVSPTIHKVGYEKRTSCMYIDFNDSKPYYRMEGVTEELFVEFVDAWVSDQTATTVEH